ncbi:MAG TPA: site-2 protease family protein [Opitutaceae bacterium]|nr:site-2 protease family protein [Opitutaceae bacterium]
MKWSLKVGRLLGIDVYLHFTFLLLLGFLWLVTWRSTGRIEAAFGGVAFVVALFSCVLLHELGHALMARRFGIATREITLLPIGGIARLERMPTNPLQELWVALAGPVVSLCIAALLFAWLVATREPGSFWDFTAEGGRIVPQLLTANLILFAFNLLPAFPMDGGRVLRALLATRLGRRRATAIAARIGQGLAILLGVVGFFSNPFLVFIAIFVFLGAQAEAGLVELQSALEGLRVRDAMMTRFRTLSTEDTVGDAAALLLAGSQQDFPLTAHGEPAGILRRHELVLALTQGRAGVALAEVMARDCEYADEAAPLLKTVESMQARDTLSMPVVQGTRFVGLLTMEHINEMLLVQAAMEPRRGSPVAIPGLARASFETVH